MMNTGAFNLGPLADRWTRNRRGRVRWRCMLSMLSPHIPDEDTMRQPQVSVPQSPSVVNHTSRHSHAR